MKNYSHITKLFINIGLHLERVLFISALGCMIFSLIGCASLQKLMRPLTQLEPTVSVQALPPYSGPKARITVADFEIKATKATNEIGSGLREMLITALVNSNRFSVVEYQVLEAVMKEQELSVSGTVDQEAKIEQVKGKAADMMINAAVTEFDPQSSGGRAGVGSGGGVGSGALGSVLEGALNKAYLTLDIRIVDTNTSRIIAATGVSGQATDVSGAVMVGFLGSWGLSGGLSVYANTPMEKAIRICIIDAVKYIVGNTPANYFKY